MKCQCDLYRVTYTMEVCSSGSPYHPGKRTVEKRTAAFHLPGPFLLPSFALTKMEETV